MTWKTLQSRFKAVAFLALAAAMLLAGLATGTRKVSGATGIVAVQYSPQAYVFGSLLPGQTRTGEVTVASSPSNVTVTAWISGDTSGGQFRNLCVIAYEVERGPNGRPLDATEVGRSDGISPLPVAKGQMVTFDFDYTAPNQPANDSYSAVLNITGTSSNQISSSWQAIRVPLYAGTGRVKTSLLQDTISILQGEAGDLPFQVESLAGPSTTASYVLDSGPAAQFISLETIPAPIPVPSGGQTQGTFRFTVDGSATPGDHTLSIYEYAFNNRQSGVLAQHPVIRVLPRDPWLNAGHPTKLLVIAPQQFEAALQPLIAHKNATDMPALLMTIDGLSHYFSGVDDPERIKRCIVDAHEKLGVRYVMLVGDASQFPVRRRFVNSIYEPDRWLDGSYNVSDLYYANLYHGHYVSSGSILHSSIFDDWDWNRDGKYNEQFWKENVAWKMNPDFVDGCPDVAVGRVPAHTAGEVSIYVNKVIRYETGNNFVYNTGRYTFLADKNYPGATSLSDEIVGDSGIGATVSSTNICRVGLDYGDTDQLASPWVKGNFDSMRVSALQTWWISYIGHGYNLGWGVLGGYGDPQVRALNNQNALPIVFSAACSTAEFGVNAPIGMYRDASDQPRHLWVDKDMRTVVDTGDGSSRIPMAYPVTVPPPHQYDFQDASRFPESVNRTFACSWLVGANEGGAIAYFGETVVCENYHGKDLEKRVLTQYVRTGERVLGEMWLKGGQQYWKDFERDENVFQAPRIYLGIMTLFGDPSLRLRQLTNLAAMFSWALLDAAPIFLLTAFRAPFACANATPRENCGRTGSNESGTLRRFLASRHGRRSRVATVKERRESLVIQGDFAAWIEVYRFERLGGIDVPRRRNIFLCPIQIYPCSIALSTARVRSRTPILDRIFET